MSEEKCEFLGHSAECFAHELNDGDYCLCNDYSNCYYKQLQTAKEENEKLNYIIDKQDRQLAQEYKNSNALTKQNKQMREALEKINNLEIRLYTEHSCYEMKDISQQALKGVE